VRGLVKPWAGVVDRSVRPQRVDHLLSVQRVAVRQRKQLDERRCLSAAPVGGRNWPTVDPDGKAPQQVDLDVHRCSTANVTP
jgi:hypothetical protein